ncbi:MAG: hypothetical protein JW891_10830 [Candidatus Lokiarchaeota archaeon]|nr:hypothetical protein [Candidatus Lokiarchaeota archaeon]
MVSPELKTKIEEEQEWIRLLPNDPRRFLIESSESFTRYKTLVDLFEFPLNHPEVLIAHDAILQDKLVNNLLNQLSDWEKDIVTGHDKPEYLLNQLWLLLDWGIKPEDDQRMKSAIETILNHQDDETGQFLAYSITYNKETKEKYPMWTSALCDHNLIVSVLLLAGLKEDKRVKKGLMRLNELLTETTQGMGWKCVPWLYQKRRGPGRVNDVCPMIVVDALRGYYILPLKDRPKKLIDAGKTLLNCWINRTKEKPYMFGHGKHFRQPRAPFFWYNIGTVLDACRHYPELVRTQAFQELIAVSLLEFPSSDGFIPKTIYRYFNQYSFGQKKMPSPWLTLFLSRIYKDAVKVEHSIVNYVKNIDARQFKGSKGGEKHKK